MQAQVGSLGISDRHGRRGCERVPARYRMRRRSISWPEQWRQDMDRQRVLERVGWRFWRCFASSFYRDTEGVVKELLEALSRMGIEPAAGDDGARATRYTEHRVILPEPISVSAEMPELGTFDLRQDAPSPTIIEPSDCIAVGDKVVLLFSDDIRRRSVRLVESKDDLEKGHLSIALHWGRRFWALKKVMKLSFVWTTDDSAKRWLKVLRRGQLHLPS